MTPSDAADRDGSTAYAPADPVAASYRDYTIDAGDAASVDLVLADAANVTVDEFGVATFETTGTAPNLTAVFGSPDGNIQFLQVNGVATTGQSFSNVTTVDGVVTVRVSVVAAAWGDVVPVAFTATSGNLPVDADGAPSNDFGVGGSTFFAPAEATNANGAATVELVNSDQGFFIADDDLAYFYSSADSFELGGTAITFAEFEAHLSVDDIIDATPYSQVTTDTFNITTDKPGEATDVTAELVDTDDPADGISDAVRVSFTAPANYNQNEWTIQYNDTTNAASWSDVNSQTVVGTAPTGTATSNASISVDVTGIATAALDEGSWEFRVVVESSVGAVDSDGSAASNTVVVPGATGAIATALTYTDSANLIDGDDFVVTFNGPVTVAAGAVIELADDAGNEVRLTRGTNATFGLDAANTVLTVTLTDNPQVLAGGALTTLAATDGAQITGTTGITLTSSGDAWNLSASGAFRSLATDVVGDNATGLTLTASSLSNQVAVDGDGTTGQDILVYSADGQTLLGSATVDANGDATVAIASGLTSGQAVTVVAADGVIEGVPAVIIIN